jgi:hypothetical protein
MVADIIRLLDRTAEIYRADLRLYDPGVTAVVSNDSMFLPERIQSSNDGFFSH